MAFIATRQTPQGKPKTLGVVRVVADPDNAKAEFAVIVRSDLKSHGLGRILMTKLIAYCRERGTREIVGDTLAQNRHSKVLCLLWQLEACIISLAQKAVRRTANLHDMLLRPTKSYEWSVAATSLR